MIHYAPGGLKQTRAGACFPRRPYDPMILANGVDAIVIGPHGAPDVWPHECRYSQLLQDKASLGWHKTNRKYWDSATSYGSCLNLADPITAFYIGSEQVIPDRTDQVFDPRTATLTTSFQQRSLRDAGSLRLRVTTFLTDEHCLVEHYDVIEAPRTPLHLEFSIRPAWNAGSCVLDQRISARPVVYRPDVGRRGLRFEYRLCGYRGLAARWYDLAAQRAPVAFPPRRNATVATPVLKSGDCLTCYTAVIDNDDAADPRRALADLRLKVRQAGYRGVRAAQVSSWRAYFQKSGVRLPLRDLQYLHDASLYVLRSVLDRRTGFLPMGILPLHWQNSMFWDSWFCSLAWLGCNHGADARRIAEFWKGKLAQGRALARKLGCPGARFAWTTNRDFFTRQAEEVVQFHNNGVVLLQVAGVWQATGDRAFLRSVFPVMEAALQFLIARLVRRQGPGVYLDACAGPDESVLDQRRSDSWTCAVIVKGIDLYLEAAQVLGRRPFQSALAGLREQLWRTLNRNVDRRGVLQSFEGGATPHWGSLIFPLFPGHPAALKTAADISIYDRELDAYNCHGNINYPARVFTWAEYWVIRILAEAGRPSAWQRLIQNAKFTNSLGGIPERIFLNGELYINWFLTAHASYLWALHGLLLQRQGRDLRVLTNLPRGWRNLSFKNLTTADGLRVSAALRRGKISRLEVVNDHAEPRAVRIRAPGLKIRARTLKSGEAWKGC